MLHEFYCFCGFERCSYVCVFKQSYDDSCFFSGICDGGPFLFVFWSCVLFLVIWFVFSSVFILRIVMLYCIVLMHCNSWFLLVSVIGYAFMRLMR
jgi:hypothetical protein